MTNTKLQELPSHNRVGMACDICKTTQNLRVSMELLSDPPIPCEWRCEDCCNAVSDGRDQKLYLKALAKLKK